MRKRQIQEKKVGKYPIHLHLKRLDSPTRKKINEYFVFNAGYNLNF